MIFFLKNHVGLLYSVNNINTLDLRPTTPMPKRRSTRWQSASRGARRTSRDGVRPRSPMLPIAIIIYSVSISYAWDGSELSYVYRMTVCFCWLCARVSRSKKAENFAMLLDLTQTDPPLPANSIAPGIVFPRADFFYFLLRHWCLPSDLRFAYSVVA
jgi:hypothetical protein